jgi:hypothetical protein
MQRGTIVMIAGISIVILNWIFSAVSSNVSDSVKGVMGYVTIGGWLVFFAGFGIKHLDKKKSAANEPKRKKRS